MKIARRRRASWRCRACIPGCSPRTGGTDIRAQLAESKGFDKADQTYFSHCCCDGVDRRMPATLEEALAPCSTGRFEELSPVERGILLLGAYELAHVPDVPYRVVINEAVELAKSFGGTDGHKYVNGVLDKLAASRCGRRTRRAGG